MTDHQPTRVALRAISINDEKLPHGASLKTDVVAKARAAAAGIIANEK